MHVSLVVRGPPNITAAIGLHKSLDLQLDQRAQNLCQPAFLTTLRCRAVALRRTDTARQHARKSRTRRPARVRLPQIGDASSPNASSTSSRAFDQRGALLDQPMTASVRAVEHRPGYGHHFATLLQRHPRRNEAAASHGCLDRRPRRREAADDPIAFGEVGPAAALPMAGTRDTSAPDAATSSRARPSMCSTDRLRPCPPPITATVTAPASSAPRCARPVDAYCQTADDHESRAAEIDRQRPAQIRGRIEMPVDCRRSPPIIGRDSATRSPRTNNAIGGSGVAASNGGYDSSRQSRSPRDRADRSRESPA